MKFLERGQHCDKKHVSDFRENFQLFRTLNVELC